MGGNLASSPRRCRLLMPAMQTPLAAETQEALLSTKQYSLDLKAGWLRTTSDFE